MKKIIVLCFAFLLFATLARAEVEGKVLSYSPEENGNIVVISEYKLNGKKIVSRYPDGNWRTRYSALNFSKEKVLEDVKGFCESNVWNEYNKKANVKNVSDQDKLEADDPNKITTLTYKTSTTEMRIDTNGDGQMDTLITLKDDGTKTSTSITP